MSACAEIDRFDLPALRSDHEPLLESGDGWHLGGGEQFRNEIVWAYRGREMHITSKFNSKHDVLLFYQSSQNAKVRMSAIAIPYDRVEKIKDLRRKVHKDSDGKEWVWETRGQAKGQKPYKRYIDEIVAKGRPISDVWADIQFLRGNDSERMGYPTQKPVSLLERVIKASSDEGGTVLDPFCGCGTAIHAAQNLNRRWIGIDICVNACKIIERRLTTHFDSLWDQIEFVGMPKTRDDAKTLADYDKFKFERWAASLVDGMEANTRQRGDQGIDGWGRMPIRRGQFIDMVSQVKGGSTGPGDVQAFNGARQQAGADLGIFTCFEDRVTHGMRDAAVNAGRFMEVPALQIYTVEDYFEERRPQLPMAA